MPPSRLLWLGLIILLSILLPLYYFLDIQLLLPRTSVVGLDEPVHSTPNATGQHKSAAVLLVSAFFPATKSKDAFGQQLKSISPLLSQIKTDLYFFTPPEMEGQIRKFRGDLPITINTSFASPFDVPPLSSYKDAYSEMHKKDREKAIHSPKMYAVGNSKPYFLEEGLQNVRLLGKKYDYAFWADSSSFQQGHAYRLWPDPSRLAAVWRQGSEASGLQEEELLFFAMNDPPHRTIQFWTESMGPVANEFSRSLFFGGQASAISWYRKAFYAYHDAYIAPSRALFVGKDQSITNAIIILFPQRFITVWANDPHPNLMEHNPSLNHLPSELPLGTCGGANTYYQFFFGSAISRVAMIDKFKSDASVWHNWPWNWRITEWFHQRNDCQLPKTQSMFEVLKSAFGQGWHSPGASINV